MSRVSMGIREEGTLDPEASAVRAPPAVHHDGAGPATGGESHHDPFNA